MGKIKKKFIVIGVIVALVLTGIIYTVVWSQDDSISNLFLGTIVENVDDTGITVESVADPNGPGSVGGDGRIKILYENTEIYSESITFSADRALKDISYSEFVIGNGDYEVEVAYKDKKVSEVYSIDWVLEYIFVDTSYDTIHKPTDDNLEISISPLGGGLSNKFSLAQGYKTDLNDHTISEGIKTEFSNNQFQFDDDEELNVIKANQKEWIFRAGVETFLIREESGGLEVYTFTGLMAKPRGLDIELTIYRDGVNIHEKKVLEADNSFIYIEYKNFDYELAGDYRFEVKAKNTLVKDDSPFADGISSILGKKINQFPNAKVGSGFSYSEGPPPMYEKTVTFNPLEAGNEFSIDFDASGSLNDGPLTYEWDWDYFNPLTEENEEFDVDETGVEVSHSFYTEPTGSHEYLALRVVGDKEADIDGDDIVEPEYSIVLIHIEFKLTI